MLLQEYLYPVKSAWIKKVMARACVKDMSTGKKLDGVTVTVFKNGAKLIDVITNASGKYEVNLDYGADFKVMCARDGFVGKNITIDTKGVPEEERQGGHGMNIDFTMMSKIEGVDYSVLLEPFGKASYTGASGNFEWDMEYTNSMRDKQAKLLKEYDDRKKREANADADFAKLMTQGSDAMTASDFKKAVGSFTEALGLKPGDAIATAKLSDARMQMESQDAENKRKEQYDLLVKAGDALIGKKDYEGAKGKFNEALAVKETEAYPKQKLKEIEAILADLAKQAEEEKKNKELQAKYDAAIAAADAAFTAENWDQATTKYTEASGLKKEEQYPKDRLAAIVVKKAESEKKKEEERLAKEMEEKYQAAVAAGDAAFKAANWDEATTKYNAAIALKEKEQYPKDQLAAIAVKKADEAKKADEEKLAKELQEKYQAAIAAGDAAFAGAKYDVARSKYEEAIALKAQEKYPKDQLVAIQKKLDEIAAKAEEERLAKDLDARYEAKLSEAAQAFTAEQYDDAIARYTEASELKPKEVYPKDQIAAIRKKKDDLAKAEEAARKAKEQQELYDKAIVDADKAFGKESWDEAKTKYIEASGIKASEQYPKDQIAAIVAKIKEAEARKLEEEKQAKYDAAIAEADKLLDKEELTTAKTKYMIATGIRPAEAYPKQRLAEIETKLAEQARLAEEERKRQEMEKRYADLISKADASFQGEKWSSALNDYKDALALKPAESHPKNRISEIEGKLDAAAKAKAEEERLAREKQDRDKQYSDLIATADKAFQARKYEEARTGYSDAAGVKSEEKYPKDQLAEIERLLAEMAQKADEAKSAAERDAAEKARQAEADSLAAIAAAKEKERLAEEERQRNASAAETEARYQEFIATADRAFQGKDMGLARTNYTSALGVRPGAQYPTDQLAAIEAVLAAQANAASDAERLAAEKKRLEEEARLRAGQDEAARLAAEESRKREEEERLKAERDAEAARMSQADRDRAERDAAKAKEENYRNAILAADEALAAKEYSVARGGYAQASDIKPDETYPLAKIDQIDKMLAELERLRLEAEAAAQTKKEAPVKVGNTVDVRKEEEAEAFMREAREQEEREKYERIKKLQADLEEETANNTDKAADRRMVGVQEKEQFQEASAGLYTGDEARREQAAQELEAYKTDLELSEQRRRERAKGSSEQSYDQTLATQEEHLQRAQTWDQRQTDAARSMADRKEELAKAEEERVQASNERKQLANDRVQAQMEYHAALHERGSGNVEEGRQRVEEAKRAQQAREANYAQTSEQKRNLNKEQLDNLPRNQPRSEEDYNRSKLAQEYPPGVTEESYTEGNKVIIRRVVVVGNKADEFSKVIAKWGTFYFKNGQSISEVTWSKETAN